MADEIKIRVAADISNLQAQMAEGAASVEEFSTKASDVLERYSEAMKGSEEQQIAFTEAIKAGQAAGLTWAQAVNEAAAALAEYNATTAEAVAVTNEMAAAEARAAAASKGLGVSARQSAAAGIGILEGRMMSGNRAASAFLSTTLGLGPVLQAAFPIIGALALGEVLIQIGTKLYDVYEKAHNAGQEIERAFGDANLKIQETTDALELHNSKLQDEIDKLSGHPSNGLETALDQAIVAADRLQLALERDNKELAALLKEHSVGIFGGLVAGVAPTGRTEKLVTQVTNEANDKGLQETNAYRDAMHAAAGDQKKQEELTRAHNEEMAKITQDGIDKIKPILNQYLQLQRDNNEKVAALHKAGLPAIPFTGGADIDYSANVKDAQGALDQLKEIHGEMLAMQDEEAKEQKLGGLRQQQENDSAANKGREKKLHDLEQEYSEEEAIYGKSANMAAAYWDQYINTFARGTTQFEAVLSKLNAANEQLGKKESGSDLFGKEREELKKLATEAKKDADEYQRALDEMAKAQATLQNELNKEQQDKTQGALEHSHDQAQGGIDVKETQVEDNAALGLGSKQEELQALKQLHDQAYNETKQYLEKEIALYADEPKKVEQYQKQMDEANRKHLQQELNDTTKILQQEQEKYKQVYGVITQSFNTALLQWQQHEETAAQAFAKMLNQMEIGVEKLVLEYLEKELLKVILQMVGLTSGASSGSSANQQTAADDKVLNPQIVESNAAAAASVVFFTSGGDLAAAAETFAEGMIFFAPAGFEKGGIVAGSHGMPVPIMAHAGERVLSAPQTQNFERMVNQSGGGSRTSINYNPSISGAFDHGSMKAMLSDHSDHILSIVRGGINSGKLSR